MLLEKLNYHATIHTPYRPFEGLMIEAKTVGTLIMQNGFDLEDIRPAAMEFFKVGACFCLLSISFDSTHCLQKAIFGDAMLLFPPSQLALAAIKHGMDSMSEFSTSFPSTVLYVMPL